MVKGLVAHAYTSFAKSEDFYNAQSTNNYTTTNVISRNITSAFIVRGIMITNTGFYFQTKYNRGKWMSAKVGYKSVFDMR